MGSLSAAGLSRVIAWKRRRAFAAAYCGAESYADLDRIRANLRAIRSSGYGTITGALLDGNNDGTGTGVDSDAGFWTVRGDNNGARSVPGSTRGDSLCADETTVNP